ncbi:membrane metallo-endopeptidase-like 1 [Ruditapes philippinarum]|uniref:membrane metallo-endopeptidase-like 1 n=1 Tax=Ruditapes philippinarum TaxID=129788 RepID=UPI00295A9FD0|nr:membrane metallo-endopeptidase-like 1 [Ruditapes philippinarum]
MSAVYDNAGFDRTSSENGNYSKSSTAAESQVQISFKREGPWKRRSACEKGLLFLVVIFLAAAVVLAVVVVRQKQELDDSTSDKVVKAPAPDVISPEVCLTADCAKASARVLENMDLTIDPCEDFYMYSCGTWKKKHVIPDDSSSYSMFGSLSEKVQVINKYLLDDNQAYQNFSSIVKAKDLYASCLDLETIEKRNSTAAVPLLEELGGWPVLGTKLGGNWIESNFSLSQLLITLRQYNNNPVINMYVSPDIRNSQQYIIYFDQPSFGLPGRLYYLQDGLARMREAYVTLASSIAKLFGADENLADREMRQMLDLEIDLANITTKPEDRRDFDALYNKMTIAQLKQNFTEPNTTDTVQFDWLEYIQGVFDIENVGIALDENEQVIVLDVSYFKRLFNVLQKHGKRTVANYVVWTIVQNRASNLDSRFRELLTDFNKVLYGIASSSARWKGCVSYTVYNFGMAVGHMFVKETFDESAKTSALNMIKNIRDAFDELLDEVEWMDDGTRILASEKANAIKEWIGYPDDVLVDEKVNKLYENVTIDRDDYFMNVLNNLKRSSAEGLTKLRQKYDKNIWTTPPSIVNAFYSPLQNAIMFPAGILQPPFYDKGQPKSMNYGGIGAVIGHEITHGFDDRGRQYDKTGNLNQWWNTSVITRFKEKAQCIIDQYNEFVVPEAGLNINGINTQGENIADNGGLKQSFRAYRKWVEKRGKEEALLPGVNFTNNQLFFINYAQVWCNNARKENIISAVNTGVHSPGQFRVVGTLQNTREFSAAFGCKKNSFMNPEKKCAVW